MATLIDMLCSNFVKFGHNKKAHVYQMRKITTQSHAIKLAGDSTEN